MTIKELRESVGLSRKQVAVIFGMSESAVKHYENGVRGVDPAYTDGIKRLVDGLTLEDGRVKSGRYKDWRKGRAHTPVAVERERCAAICEEAGHHGTAGRIREGK